MAYFERDARAVAEGVRQDPEIFLRTISMVLLSIRQPWLKIPQQLEDVTLSGAASRFLFGFKKDGYTVAKENLTHFHGAVKDYEGDLDSLILNFMDIPGLGLAKASFLAQLTVNDGACLDGHNLRRIGKSENFVRISKTAGNIRERIAAYNATWREHGDSAFWWDSWCDLIGERYGVSGSEISALHRMPLNETSTTQLLHPKQ